MIRGAKAGGTYCRGKKPGESARSLRKFIYWIQGRRDRESSVEKV